jgi:hypothetical protein
LIFIITIIIAIKNSSNQGYWVEASAPKAYWTSVTSDYSGQNLAAVQRYIFISSDG